MFRKSKRRLCGGLFIGQCPKIGSDMLYRASPASKFSGRLGGFISRINGQLNLASYKKQHGSRCPIKYPILGYAFDMRDKLYSHSLNRTERCKILP